MAKKEKKNTRRIKRFEIKFSRRFHLSLKVAKKAFLGTRPIWAAGSHTVPLISFFLLLTMRRDPQEGIMTKFLIRISASSEPSFFQKPSAG